jgi:hypothetical protein
MGPVQVSRLNLRVENPQNIDNVKLYSRSLKKLSVELPVDRVIYRLQDNECAFMECAQLKADLESGSPSDQLIENNTYFMYNLRNLLDNVDTHVEMFKNTNRKEHANEAINSLHELINFCEETMQDLDKIRKKDSRAMKYVHVQNINPIMNMTSNARLETVSLIKNKNKLR